jgi:hypothetical protein
MTELPSMVDVSVGDRIVFSVALLRQWLARMDDARSEVLIVGGIRSRPDGTKEVVLMREERARDARP